MKKSIKNLSISICLAIGLLWGFAFLINKWAKSSPSAKNIQNDFEIKEEVKHGRSDVVKTWVVSLILSPQSYSKNRIEELFTIFSSKHPNRDERLTVYIYTSEEDWQNERNTPPFIPMTKKGEDPLRPKFQSFAKAIFHRPTNSDVSEDHDEIWYIYRPDIQNPDERETYAFKDNSWVRIYPNQTH